MECSEPHAVGSLCQRMDGFVNINQHKHTLISDDNRDLPCSTWGSCLTLELWPELLGYIQHTPLDIC